MLVGTKTTKNEKGRKKNQKPKKTSFKKKVKIQEPRVELGTYRV